MLHQFIRKIIFLSLTVESTCSPAKSMTEVYCKPQQKKVVNQKIQTKYMKTVTENSKETSTCGLNIK